ncbi:hypothetical protein CAPTEDRAFT_204851 [Capitella teleta]|uniref:Transmembrane protein n=1 Tax=Capitella teleta TaxID=283909 RepID=R7U2F1_CAPTE|nr:hypothetical protein CAPTEDRAFT_204851 [Capitella teleta]|eukprot:ELT97335.1 hypothetical protein CAPTEDRAFT_204851 [Capitella teleta]
MATLRGVAFLFVLLSSSAIAHDYFDDANDDEMMTDDGAYMTTSDGLAVQTAPPPDDASFLSGVQVEHATDKIIIGVTVTFLSFGGIVVRVHRSKESDRQSTQLVEQAKGIL